ncbi:MAG: flagellar protein FlaG [Rhodocyclaceae bacterium]|nr:flagellar protein FlaG [Rhodocyclaceae bacterium]
MNIQVPPPGSANSAAGATPAPGGNGQAAPASAGAPKAVVQPGAETSVQAKQPTAADLQKAVTDLQNKVQAVAPDIQFSIDHGTGRTVIEVTDASTHTVIRQIPSAEILGMDAELDRMQGLLLNKRV